MMCGNVMHDEFWTHENNITIWDKKIPIPAWRVELTQFAFVNAKGNHWLPRVLHQLLELREGIRIHFASRERLILDQPANRTKRLTAFCAEEIALCQIIEVRHGSFFKG